MPNKPTFLLVPGSFLPPECYNDTAKQLWSRGFKSHVVTLPSIGSPDHLTSNEPDVIAIRRALEVELTYSFPKKNIIIVAHSYGSIPTCEAVKGFRYLDRLMQGKPNGVIRMIFVAAWLLKEKESTLGLQGKYYMKMPWARFDDGKITVADPIAALFNDTSEEVANYWIPQMTHSSLNAFKYPLQYAAWRDIPTTYLVCESDQCIPPQVQWGMLASIGGVKMAQLSSGHLPMISKTDEFVEFLEREASEESSKATG